VDREKFELQFLSILVNLFNVLLYFRQLHQNWKSINYQPWTNFILQIIKKLSLLSKNYTLIELDSMEIKAVKLYA
jgi:hypothetical protein